MVPWEVSSTSIDAFGIVEVGLTLAKSDEAAQLHPFDWLLPVALAVRIRIVEELEVSLTTTNNSDRDIRFVLKQRMLWIIQFILLLNSITE